MAKTTADTASDNVTYWLGELNRAKKRFRTFWDNGDRVVDEYRLQRADGNDLNAKDKYNILYSSTETIRPNLYAQTPKPRVALRNKDTATDPSRAAAMLLEGCLGYLQQEEDFDELMEAVVEDYMLPGLGQGWVRYEATLGDITDSAGKPTYEADGKTPQQELLDEMVKMEYVYWQDFLTGVARTWKEVPWVARRLWLNEQQATKRFGADKAKLLTYKSRETSNRDNDNPSETAEAWEIWDKASKKVYWFAEGLSELLDDKDDPLKLKGFFPCPKPLRAISNTRTFVPRALYSQYKSQAETLNTMTKRIRLLSEALKVVGVYDGSMPKLADALNPNSGNRMIPVEGWAQFAQAGGMAKSVDWVPIKEVVEVLTQLIAAREVCKQEIYEITGFSDIQRGVSKASETLGAQNIKSDWAGARVKKSQAAVQDFARDMLSLAGELIAEHCSPETIALFSGLPVPDPEAVAANPQLQQQVQLFATSAKLLKNDIRRVATIDIETDSTLLADESAEREDRTKFLAAAGAFLQQAVPAMAATPELGPLLGSMLMFVVRTFPSSRPIEEEFEKVQMSMGQQQPDQDKDGKKAQAAADQAKNAADAANKQQELTIRQQHEQATAVQAQATETNRHSEKMMEMSLRDKELGIQQQRIQIEQTKLDIAKQDANTRQFAATSTAAVGMADNLAGGQAAQDQLELDYEELGQDDKHRTLDRQAEAEQAEAQAEATKEAAQTAQDGQGGGSGGDGA